VFLVEAPFGKRDEARLNLASLQQAGAAAEVWDCSIAMGNASEPTPPSADDSGIRVRKFVAIDDLTGALTPAEARTAFFICLVGLRGATLPLFRALGKAKARYALLLGDVQPFGNTALRSQRARGLARVLLGLRRGESLLRGIALRLFGVRSPELIIAGGEGSLTTAETDVANRDTKVLWAHTLDYDRFLELRLAGRAKSGAVFLDQFLADHADQIRSGHRFCDPTTYYANLNRAFASIESSLGEPLTVAAHPSANYLDRDTRFGGREIVWGRTAELVAGSRWVIAHDSTAVGYAVLVGVPVTFVTDNGIRESAVRRTAADAMAHLLKRRLYNLDEDSLPTWDTESSIDPEAYREYRTAFLKRSGSPDTPLWFLFMSYLRGELQTEPLRARHIVSLSESPFP